MKKEFFEIHNVLGSGHIEERPSHRETGTRPQEVSTREHPRINIKKYNLLTLKN